MPEKLTLEGRIDLLEQEGPIEPATINLTVEDPDMMRRLFAHYYTYSQVVEHEVPASEDMVRVIVPNMDVVFDRFLNVAWVPLEKGHDVALGLSMDHLQIDRIPPRQKVTEAMKLLGRLAKISPGLHDTTEFVVATYMALGELETEKFYSEWGHNLRHRGEIPQGQLMHRIARDEGGHLHFLKDYAHEKKHYLKPWQLRIGQIVIEHGYGPVGTHRGNDDMARRRHMGHLAFSVAGDNVEGFTNPVEHLARELLEVSGHMNPFVTRQYKNCIEAYRRGIPA